MVFQCACSSKFDDLEALTTHVKKHGHAHRCSTCDKFFKSKGQLLAHRKEAGHGQPGLSPRAPETTIQYRICSCGKRFKTVQGLKDHQQDTQHVESASAKPPKVAALSTPSPIPTTCLMCNKRCANADGLKAHKAALHPCCPTCKQQFHSLGSCSQHQRAAGHCYCREHEKAFRDASSYKSHLRETLHVTGFECVDCDRSFESQIALDDHLASPGHASVLLAAQNAEEAARKALEDEETNMRCEECKRDFKSVKAYQQHKQSLKHKPLSQLTCPVSSECQKKFTSPSSLLLHLESGGCKSGMNRLKLNALVHQYDTARQITSDNNVEDVLTTASAAGALPTTADVASLANLSLASPRTLKGNAETSSTFSGVLVEANLSDTESIDSGVLVSSRTLSRSSSLPAGGVDILSRSSTTDEWSFLELPNSTTAPPLSSIAAPPPSEIHYDHKTASYPCIIADCTKSFKTHSRLMQHLYSPFHAPKLFRCPTASLLGIQSSATAAAGEHEKVFKTLSGFAMHLESGKCGDKGAGGQDVLREIVGLFERRILEVMGREVKLLM